MATRPPTAEGTILVTAVRMRTAHVHHRRRRAGRRPGSTPARAPFDRGHAGRVRSSESRPAHARADTVRPRHQGRNRRTDLARFMRCARGRALWRFSARRSSSLSHPRHRGPAPPRAHCRHCSRTFAASAHPLGLLDLEDGRTGVADRRMSGSSSRHGAVAPIHGWVSGHDLGQSGVVGGVAAAVNTIAGTTGRQHLPCLYPACRELIATVRGIRSRGSQGLGDGIRGESGPRRRPWVTEDTRGPARQSRGAAVLVGMWRDCSVRPRRA
jgi:hypothetical protein